MSNEKIPPAGATYKVEKSTKWVKSGNHATGTPRNEGLSLDKDWMRSDRNEDSYATVPEYSEKQSGGRTRIKTEANKENASKPSGARPDNTPDNRFARSTSGPVPTGKPVTGAAPRHNIRKIVTSTPNGGPRQAKGKDSTNVNDSTAYGRNYGNREPVTDPVVRKRSDVVPSEQQ